jgi:transketolase
LSRQNLPQLTQRITDTQIVKGGYVLSDSAKPDVVLIATGSEVSLAMQAQEILRSKGKSVLVVSMPCTSVFDRQSQEWRDSVLPKGVRRIAIEAGQGDLWWKYVGIDGAVIGINRFGESAPAAAVYKALGITVDRIVEIVLS